MPMSDAETRALEAQELPPFQDLNLVGVKNKVSETLGLIGRGRIFHEYTLHDVSHVDKMLASLDWVIPDSSKQAMTPTDWLLIVLAVYLHDLGMLVTDSEFDARGESDFDRFCNEKLFLGDAGTDYRNKIDNLGEDRDRFLYQEYIRAHHAARIADWINGKVDPRRGVAEDAAAVIADVLRSLPSLFKRDLALVCASHHLDDLHDTERYAVSQPYGDSDPETANVQYAALLLRSVDLLHITSDRTPSVMFRLINPQDPVSQREWAKQSAVTRVRPQKGRDEDGNFQEGAPQDTVEVFAAFDREDPFFGLTSYLSYAGEQLRQVNEWATASANQFDHRYLFPWKRVDTNNVKAEGFLNKQLEFSLDQTKILELLTGHTLYNDTSVVVRELVQNAIDAVRLQAHIAGSESSDDDVCVEWIEARRELVVRDRGTGMTWDVIERNLLRAGSSRYQEETFRKRYPNFSPISRFGIGVLSTFMIADAVTISTITTDSDDAYQLTLRSVHGKYLVRKMDKGTDEAADRIGDHGTEFRLVIRQSAELPDILETLAKWIVVPNCGVQAIVNEQDPVSIGFDSPEDALTQLLPKAGFEIHSGNGDPQDKSVRVLGKVYNGVHTAFAVQWDRFFREWTFLTALEVNFNSDLGARLAGTCVEGIRVEETSAGFRSKHAVGLANATGNGAPKTNVARVGLDSSLERRTMLHSIYRAYLDHIVDECVALQERRGQSLTWAAQEAEFVLQKLLRAEDSFGTDRQLVEAVEPSTLNEEIGRQPLLLIEHDGERTLRKGADLGHERTVWTIDSGLVRAAEGILREVSAEGSLDAIASGFKADVFRLPEGGPTLVGYLPKSILHQQALADREVRSLAIRRDDRRVDVGWDQLTEEPAWIPIVSIDEAERDAYPRERAAMYVSRPDVRISGGDGESGVRAHDVFYLLGDTPIGQWMFDAAPKIRGNWAGDVLAGLVRTYLSQFKIPGDLRRWVEAGIESRVVGGMRESVIEEVDFDGFVDALPRTKRKVFDTWAWRRRGLLQVSN